MKPLFAKIFLILIFSLFSACKGNYYFLKTGQKQRKFSSYERLEKYARKKIEKYRAKGYVFAEFKKLSENQFVIQKGQCFFSDTTIWLDKKIIVKKGEKLNFRKIDENLAAEVNLRANNGYPFAYAAIDTVIFSENRAKISVKFDKGTRVKFNELKIYKPDVIKQSFLERFLNVRRGKLFDNQVVTAIPEKLSTLEYIKILKPYEIDFYDSLADVYVFIDKAKSDVFSGNLGFDNRNGKLALTGELKLDLKNSFKGGEEISFFWQRTQKLSQKLNISLLKPYFLGTRFGYSFETKLYKQDSTFVNADFGAGVNFFFSGKNYFGVSAEKFYGINLIEHFDNQSVVNTNFGFVFRFDNVIFPRNPKRGNLFEAKIFNGSQKVSDSVFALKKFIIGLDFFTPVGNKFVLFSGFDAGGIFCDKLAKNQLFRLGGLTTIRGFNTDLFYASEYFYANLELRYRPSYKNFFFLFTDLACLFEPFDRPNARKNLISAGLGLNLSGKNTALTLVGAVGSINGTFDYRNPKLHIGIRNYF